jgi:hypothetical protein
MGILDKLKQGKDEELQKQGDSALDKAGQTLDEKTGGQHSSQIDAGVNKAEQMLGKDTQGPDAPDAQSPQDAQGAQDGATPTEDTQEQPPAS